MCKFFLPQTIFAIFTYIHDNAQHTLHNLLPLQKTIDYCQLIIVLEMATQWKLVT